MLDLQLDHGFDSPSGFREAFARIFGTPPSGARALDCLYAKWMETPLGADARARQRRRIAPARVRRPPRPRARDPGACDAASGITSFRASIAISTRSRAELDAYFAGRSLAFATPLRLDGSPFQLSVWNALLAIPSGSTRSYADIAATIRHPSAVRAVGRANGDNKLAVIVPCHRVVGANGTLTGYGGGLWRKAWLLEHERTHAGGRGQAIAAGRRASTAPRPRSASEAAAYRCEPRISRACSRWPRYGAARSRSSALRCRRSGPIWLAESRVALAFAALFAVALIRRDVPSLAAHWRAYLVIGAVNSALPFALFSFAEQTISASNAAILNATSPFFGAIVAAAWLREPLGARRMAGMALGLLGVVLLVGWQPAPLSSCGARGRHWPVLPRRSATVSPASTPRRA